MAAKARFDSGRTKVRFIMLEADGDSSDLQHIAQAITNALRPPVIQQMAALPATHSLPRNGNHPPAAPGVEDPQTIDVELADTGTSDDLPAPKKASGNGAKRAYPAPTVLDLDLTSGDMPFLRYYREKNPKEHSKKYLVIAAWFKEYRQLDEISDDHIYTCYKFLKMNVTNDIGSHFRGGKKNGWYRPGSQRGWYAINHIGLNQVNDLNAAQ